MRVLQSWRPRRFIGGSNVVIGFSGHESDSSLGSGLIEMFELRDWHEQMTTGTRFKRNAKSPWRKLEFDAAGAWENEAFSACVKECGLLTEAGQT